MIESCSRKRMVIAIAFLIGLSILVLIIENELAPNDTRPHTHTTAHPNMTQKDLCWMREETDNLEECQPCTDLEKKSNSPPICGSASYRQKVKCKDTGIVFKKCDRVVWIEERNFWTFEAVTGAVGLIAGLATVARQKVLDHRILQRIQRQVAAGV
ncbi:protein JTB-like [Palaemon carinicauda]|uniref:protein JTB-like n=1 Tax=Palaemon carinicauda TaxID=392227 RepID=UPI0035B69FF5